MFFFLLFLVFMIVVKIKVFSKDTFNEEYLSKDNTKVIKGIFVILVLFSHYVQYVNLDSMWDEPYLILRAHLNQMVVAPFLFYSGYGIMLSIQKRGQDYVSGIMKYRFPRVWCEFALAVFSFLIINTILGKTFSLEQILLSFVGWSSIGNSNWYILGILILYVLTWIAFTCVKKLDFKGGRLIACSLLTFFTIGVVYVFMRVDRPDYYYNTLILYVAGFWYALIRERIESIVMKSGFVYLVCFTFVTGGYCISYLNRWNYGIEGYTIWAIMFIILLLLISMKVSIQSNILSWFGEHVFSIYILQRIPMIVLNHFGFAENHKYMFLIMSLLYTMVLAVIFEYIVERLVSKFRLYLTTLQIQQ